MSKSKDARRPRFPSAVTAVQYAQTHVLTQDSMPDCSRKGQHVCVAPEVTKAVPGALLNNVGAGPAIKPVTSHRPGQHSARSYTRGARLNLFGVMGWCGPRDSTHLASVWL